MSLAEPDPAVARQVLREIEQGFVGMSRAASAVRVQTADFLARHATELPPPPMLLRGEVGVGKSLLARLLHQVGPRADRLFLDVGLKWFPPALIEPYLFGYEPGAVTGAREAMPGLFQVANGATIFLDEVGLLSNGLQTKLLAVIEERTVRRVGGTRAEPVDVWIVAATNEDLRSAVQHQLFRADLYQRLAQLDLLLPPLRQRGDDILLLAEHFLARMCAEYHLPPKTFAPDARSALLVHPWPGNVREVEHVIKRVTLLDSESHVITATMLALPKY